jgi:hypothetical protein
MISTKLKDTDTTTISTTAAELHDDDLKYEKKMSFQVARRVSI